MCCFFKNGAIVISIANLFLLIIASLRRSIRILGTGLATPGAAVVHAVQLVYQHYLPLLGVPTLTGDLSLLLLNLFKTFVVNTA